MFPPISGYVKLPPEKFAPKKQGAGGGKELPTEAKKLQLNSAEELYAEIRDKNFNAVGSVLSKKAKIISAAFEVRQAGMLMEQRSPPHRGPSAAQTCLACSQMQTKLPKHRSFI